MNLCLFASGSGTNAVNLFEHFKDHPQIKIEQLVVNKPHAPVIEKFQNTGVKIHVISDEGLSRIEHEKKVLEAINVKDETWAVLAGYMKIIGNELLSRFRDDEKELYRMINIHPSYLPLHPGLKGFEKSWGDNNDYGGVTVHLVEEEVDSGPIIVQEKLFKKTATDFNDFVKSGHQLEYKLYPQAILNIHEKYYANLPR